MRSVSHHSSLSEGCDLNKKFDESYLCDQTTFSKGITTPAAMEALNVAKCFISYYRLPLHLIKFAWMEHPKGTIIVDGNGNAVMNEHSSDSKKLSLGRRSAMYFRLPVCIPSLGLDKGKLIGFVGDKKVLNSKVGINCYLLCEPFSPKEWKLIGVVDKHCGKTTIDITRVCQVVNEAMSVNCAKRKPFRKHRKHIVEDKTEIERTEFEEVRDSPTDKDSSTSSSPVIVSIDEPENQEDVIDQIIEQDEEHDFIESFNYDDSNAFLQFDDYDPVSICGRMIGETTEEIDYDMMNEGDDEVLF